MSTWKVVRRLMSLKKYERGVPFSVTTSSMPSSVSWRRSVSRSAARENVQTGSSTVSTTLADSTARPRITARRGR